MHDPFILTCRRHSSRQNRHSAVTRRGHRRHGRPSLLLSTSVHSVRLICAAMLADAVDGGEHVSWREPLSPSQTLSWTPSPFPSPVTTTSFGEIQRTINPRLLGGGAPQCEGGSFVDEGASHTPVGVMVQSLEGLVTKEAASNHHNIFQSLTSPHQNMDIHNNILRSDTPRDPGRPLPPLQHRPPSLLPSKPFSTGSMGLPPPPSPSDFVWSHSQANKLPPIAPSPMPKRDEQSSVNTPPVYRC